VSTDGGPARIAVAHSTNGMATRPTRMARLERGRPARIHPAASATKTRPTTRTNIPPPEVIVGSGERASRAASPSR